MSRRERRVDSDPDQITLQLVAERIKGLSKLTERGFIDIQRQLDDVRGLPTIVSQLQANVTALISRVDAIEEDRTKGAEFRRGNLPIILLTLALALSSIISLVAQLR